MSKEILRGSFKVIVDGVLQEFTDYNQIPLNIDNVVSFKPEYIPPPHTPEEHDENEKWVNRFNQLLERESNENI